MVVHVYSCLLTGIIPVQIHTGNITWNGTGIFKLIHVPGISGKHSAGRKWNFIVSVPDHCLLIYLSCFCSGVIYSRDNHDANTICDPNHSGFNFNDHTTKI